MIKSLSLALLCSLALALGSCAGPGRAPSSATVVTVGSLSSGSRIAQVISPGREWSVELGASDLSLNFNGVVALFKDAKTGERVNYRFDSESSTWVFLLNGGEVHWRGEEVRVGETTHDLSVPGEYVFSAADWSAPK